DVYKRQVANGERAIFTTTTKIWQPAPTAFDLLLIEPDAEQVLAQLQQCHWQSACIVAKVASDFNDPATLHEARFATPLPDHMPVLPRKMAGYAPETICHLAAHLPDCHFVVEADGARGSLIKAPAAHEPMIPACTERVFVVASQAAIGQPLGANIAHRPELISQLTGLNIGDIITVQALNTLLAHPLGGRKGVPPNAGVVIAMSHEP
ncbi:MAG: selenium cofactor biosynthesis protein YqeC, partial [Anaerolineae bacterium]|nr:selenium cofactor biosynthesis protein YqeC [Anaerolineae bacterium]